MVAIELKDLPKAETFWYLASPYSKYDEGICLAHILVCKITARMVVAGHKVFSPIAHTHPIALYGGIDFFDHSVWLPLDEPMMAAASGLVVANMRGWAQSYGVEQEIAKFEEAGKPVHLLLL